MGPATIVETLPEKTGNSGTVKTYMGRGRVLFFNYNNAQNTEERHMIEHFLIFSSCLYRQ